MSIALFCRTHLQTWLGPQFPRTKKKTAKKGSAQFPPLWRKISFWTSTRKYTKPSTTRDSARASGLFAFCCILLVFVFTFFFLLLFVVFTFREVIQAPADGDFDVQWADGKKIGCSPAKLVKVPCVGETFESDGRQYKVLAYTAKMVECRIFDKEDPKPQQKTLTRRQTRRQNRQALTPTVSTCDLIACVLVFMRLA